MTQFTIGTVHLNVANLDNQLRFYQEVIGLQVHHNNGTTAGLGVGADDLLRLYATPDRQRVRGITGLYHFAILVPSRLQLAKSLRHLAETQTRLQGLSDHYVSEAIYLADPEGNGIEIYHDRPQADWYDANGDFVLNTAPMDVDGVMGTLAAQNATWEGLPAGTIMGHIHLHVAAIPQTETFYRQVLGMDIMTNIGSATFMSYDGYHHHVGANIWGGRALPSTPTLGLEKYNLHSHDDSRLQTILANLDAIGTTITETDGTYTFHDPSHNQIVLQSA